LLQLRKKRAAGKERRMKMRRERDRKYEEHGLNRKKKRSES
jgi:hypothetical protein